MSEPKIYISGYFKKYHDNDPDRNFRANQVELKESLGIMTDEWICEGNCANQTIMDLRDAVKYFMRENEQSPA